VQYPQVRVGRAEPGQVESETDRSGALRRIPSRGEDPDPCPRPISHWYRFSCHSGDVVLTTRGGSAGVMALALAVGVVVGVFVMVVGVVTVVVAWWWWLLSWWWWLLSRWWWIARPGAPRRTRRSSDGAMEHLPNRSRFRARCAGQHGSEPRAQILIFFFFFFRRHPLVRVLLGRAEPARFEGEPPPDLLAFGLAEQGRQLAERRRDLGFGPRFVRLRGFLYADGPDPAAAAAAARSLSRAGRSRAGRRRRRQALADREPRVACPLLLLFVLLPRRRVLLRVDVPRGAVVVVVVVVLAVSKEPGPEPVRLEPRPLLIKMSLPASGGGDDTGAEGCTNAKTGFGRGPVVPIRVR
jgi:hypothetical protein